MNRVVSSVVGQASVHACVGVVRNPCRGIRKSELEWTCNLLLTECGCSSGLNSRGRLVSQQMLLLRCRGTAMASFCFLRLREGGMIHVVSKVMQRPRYISAHEDYFSATELLVSDSFGSITVVAEH